MEMITQQNNSQYDINEDEAEINSGDYWLKRDTKDDVRLISSLNIIDDILHSLVVEPNPRTMWRDEYGHESNRSWEIDEFLRLYEPINQDRAKEIREADLAKLQEEMGVIGKELAIGYVDDGVGSTEKLIAISSKNKSDMSLPIAMANEKNIISMKARTEEVRDIIVKQKDFIKDKTKALSLKSKNLSAIYQEQASRSLASIDGTIKFIAKLEKSIHTLDIFTGEGVEVYKLSEGDDAPEDEKITFYQRKLFLDEEFWVDIANGGADYNSIEDFKEALQKDINVIKSMLPAEKSVVLMQFRRNDKQRYNTGNDYNVSIAQNMLDLLANIEEDEENRKQFLFIRNGKNVYIVFSKDIQGGSRLFPTEEEISAIFKTNGSNRFEGVEVDKYLNFKDLANKEARDNHDAVGLYYKRLLVLMYGLHERNKKVFGESVVGDWFGLDFQKNNFNFIHDDEDALDYNSKSLNEFVKEKNSTLQVGSRVLADWRYLMNEDNAKGMYSTSIHYDNQQIYRPIYTEEPQIIESVDGKFCCYILCKHDAYSYTEKKDRRVKVELSSRDDVFVIDYIKPKEISFYINSRKHRSEYASYAIMLLGVKNLLQREEDEARPNVEFLKAHIKSLLPDFNESILKEKLFESMSFWRIKNREHKVPDIAISKNEKILKEVSEIFFNKTVNNKNKIFKEYVIEHNENVITISTDNKGKFFAYSEVEEKDRLPFGKYEVYPFVKRVTYKLLKTKGFRVESIIQVKYGFYSKNEEVIEELRRLQIDKYCQDIDNRYIDSYAKLKSNIATSSEMFNKIVYGGNVDELLEKLFEDMKTRQRNSTRRQIENYNISFLTGLWFVDKSQTGYFETYYKNFSIVMQNTNIDMLIARYGGDELYEKLVTWISKNYARPDSELSTVREIRETREKKVNIFSLSSSRDFFTKGSLIVRNKLEFNSILINKKRYFNFPIRSSVKNKDLDLDDESAVKEDNNFNRASEDKKSKIILERIL